MRGASLGRPSSSFSRPGCRLQLQVRPLGTCSSVLWVHGPGGIGKSTLLGAYAEAARNAGFTVAHIDARRIRPTPAGIQAALRESLDPVESVPEPSAGPDGDRGRGSMVVIVDAAERLEPAEGWLREEFLPSLPAQTVVVIAGRRPPGEEWRADPGWREPLRVVSLRNLSRDAVQHSACR